MRKHNFTWYEMRWTQITAWNGANIIVPVKVEQLNDDLFWDTFKSTYTKSGVAKWEWDEAI